jgi:dolichyl-diphosphooligosaccharide--protein glycosyltransferase
MQRWYPSGVVVSGKYYPGLAMTAAFTYEILHVLAVPISLYDLCVIFPVIMAALTVLAMYFLGKDVGGKAVGLFSALFLALNASYIGRTSLGFFDDETIGIFAIVILAYAFLRALDTERTWNSTIGYSIVSGLMLGLIFASWGGAAYPLGLLIAFAFVAVLLKRYSRRLLLSYSITCGLGLFVAVNIPRLGFAYLTDIQVIATLGVLSLLCLCELINNIKTTKWKLVYTLSFLVLGSVALVMVFASGASLAEKFANVINPFLRSSTNAIFQSVQEHQPTAWGSFYFDYGVGIFFVIIGLYFAARNPTNRNLFLILYALTSLYFASSLARLLIVLAPAFSILWAMGLGGIMKPFVTVMKETPKTPFQKKYVFAHVGKEFSGAAFILIMLLLLVTFILPSEGSGLPRVFNQAYSPVTIMAASVPIRPDEPVLEWYETLMWMKTKLPHDTVIASWWDYGYWISIIGNQTTLVDNGTFDTNKIGEIGKMFMSNVTEAVQILKKFNATYVAVFTTFDKNGNAAGYGDEGKWTWMAKIANLDDKSFGNYTLGKDQVYDSSTQQSTYVDNAKGQNTTLYKLMEFAKQLRLDQSPTVALFDESGKGFGPAYISTGKNYGGLYIVVAVYRVTS